MRRATAFLLSGLVLLAGCGSARQEAAVAPPPDAVVVDALADPIMSDPDLTAQNRAHSALAASGPLWAALPPIDRSDAAIAAAHDEAERLAGGTIPAVPDPVPENAAPLREAVTAAQMAVAARIGRPDCAQGAAYTAAWAVRLPAPLQVYPRGAVDEAAGSDAAGCGLRVVHFRTPVAIDEVVAFYHARLRAAGWPMRHGAQGDDHVLRGRKGPAAYAVYLRKAADGLTAADIVVAGV